MCRVGQLSLVVAFCFALGVSPSCREFTRAAGSRQEFSKWSAPRASIVRRGGLAVRVTGTDGPAILLLHGMFGSGGYWGSAFETLGADHRLIVPDLLGFGDSPKPEVAYSAEEHVSAIRALLEDSGIREPVLIVGHSLGSLIALRFAALHPDSVRGLVLVGPPLYRNSTDARRRLDALSPMGDLLLSDGFVARSVCRTFHNHPRLAASVAGCLYPEFPRSVLVDSAKHSWESFWRTTARVVLPAEGTRWLKTLRVPVRLIAGTQDPAVDHGLLSELASSQEGVHYNAVEGGGHHLPLSHPASCLEQIRYLDRSRAEGREVHAGPSVPGRHGAQ